MFRIEMLPAAHGDCLWIEFGNGAQTGRILIDGGPAHTYPTLRDRLLHLPPDERRFDLLVITHIDGDHIEGVIRLLQDAEALNCTFDRIWFNGREQLNQVPDLAGAPLGAVQGEILGLLIADYERRTGTEVWNRDLPGRLAAIDRKTGVLPRVESLAGCRVTLLSPDHERLLDLKDRWRAALRAARVTSGDEQRLRLLLESSRGLRPLGDVLGADDDAGEDRYELPDPLDRDLGEGLADALGGEGGEPGAQAPFGSDGSAANGSSIALLLEYPADAPTLRFVLAGDAWPAVLEASVDLLLPAPGQRLALTGFKLPHHGSVANVTESLLGKLACSHYLVSTSGAVFRHPHARAVELLLSQHAGPGRPRLHFNYLTVTTAPWSDAHDQRRRRYDASHPKGTSLVL
jgi:hypothetical protein